MEKLELKHLAPYLPYGLKFEVQGSLSSVEIKEATGFKLEHLSYINKHVYQIYFNVYGYEFKDIKPILRPLSDLTKEHTLELKNDNDGCSWAEKLLGKNLRFFNYLTYKPMFNNYWEFESLVENHFDVFGLIEKGLAVNFNTLN